MSKKYISLFSILFAVHCVIAQSTCPFNNPIQITQNDVFIDCDFTFETNNCFTLNATYTDLKSTSNYTVAPITYFPVAAFDAGTIVPIAADDKWSSVIALPFRFCFYGNYFDNIVVGDNGVLSFQQSLAGLDCIYVAASLPNPAMYPNSIYGAFHDITNDDNEFGCTDNPNTAENECGEIRTYSFGAAPCRTFVINYNNINHFNCENSRSTTQIVLYEGSNIIDIYVKEKPINCETPVTTSNAYRKNALIGILNANGTQAVTPTGRNSGVWAATNEAYRFTPNGNSIASVRWKNANGFVIGNGTSIQVCPTTNTNYTAEVVYNNCDNTEIVYSDNISVTFDPLYPYANNYSTAICDELPYGNENVDITQYLSNIIGAQTGVTTSYHISLSDAQNDVSPIANPTNYNLTASNGVIYVRVEREPDCFTVGVLTLNLSLQPFSNISQIDLCDVNDDHIEHIILTDYNDEILGTQSGVSIAYYTSATDAAIGINAITEIDATDGMSIFVNLNIGGSCVNIVEIKIYLSQSVVINQNIDATLCDNQIVNLNSYIPAIIGAQTGLTYSFYTTNQNAVDEVNPIANPTSYSPQGDVFVRVENVGGCYSIAVIHFTINSTVTTSSDIQVKCDADDNGTEIFDLTTSIPSMIANPANYTITYYDVTNGGNMLINNPSAYVGNVTPRPIIKVVFTDNTTGCIVSNNIFLYVEPIPEPANDEINVCDIGNDGAEHIFFSSYSSTLLPNPPNQYGFAHYFATLTDAQNFTNELTEYDLTADTTFYLVTTVEFEGNVLCTSTQVYQVTFKLTPVPLLTPISVTICDNNQFGNEVFDLTQFENVILPTASAFHYSNDNGVTLIANPTNYIVNESPEVINVYASDGTCNGETTITINLKPIIPINPAQLDACDFDENGTETFNLASSLSSINPDFSNYTISYYENFSDADAGNTNTISNPTNYISNTKDVYVRLVNIEGCYTVATLHLELYTLPQIIDNTVDACDADNNGNETNVLLNQFNTQIIGAQTGITVSYYNTLADANTATNAITNADLVNGMQLFVRLERPAGCVTTGAITFKFISLNLIEEDTFEVCDNNNDNVEIVDLTQFETQIISTNADYTFNYFLTQADAQGNINPIVDPTQQSVTNTQNVFYVRLFHIVTNCVIVFPITINFGGSVVANIGELGKCDFDVNLSETFDLTQAESQMIINPSNYTITYFTDNNAANTNDTTYQIINPTNFVANGETTIVYVRFYNAITGCYTVKDLILRVVTLPKLIDSDAIACDNNLDGIYSIDLTSLNNLIIEDTTGLTFNYYLTLADAQANTNAINTNITDYPLGISFPMIIYVSAQDIYSCRSIAQVEITTGQMATINPLTNVNLQVCDDNYDGISVFDLTQFESNITNDATATFTYYPTFSDMQNETNVIITPNSYSNTIPFQTIYVRVEIPDFCPNYTTFNIQVLPIPTSPLPSSYEFCANESVVLNAENSSDSDTYLWSTGETTSSITVSQAGNYSVTITSGMNGCPATFTTNVTTISIPDITYEFLDINKVEITVLGTSVYEYSLDQINWQTDNIFTISNFGIKTIYVRDAVTGCVNSVEVLILEIFNVITPNGDSFNDTWHVRHLDILGAPATLYIYDRYGKMIYTQISETEFIWDGTYLGRHLPSSSYWYTIELPDGRKYNGYIVLKNYYSSY